MVTGPPFSPATFTVADYRGRAFTVLAQFSNTSPYTLTSVTVARAPGCSYVHLYFGLGPDGIPDTAAVQVPVAGTTVALNVSQLAALGFSTATDLFAVQMTAGP